MEAIMLSNRTAGHTQCLCCKGQSSSRHSSQTGPGGVAAGEMRDSSVFLVAVQSLPLPTALNTMRTLVIILLLGLTLSQVIHPGQTIP